MVACEGLLLLTLLILGLYVIYTDISMGVVKNRALVYSLGIGIVINTLYYCIFAKAYFLLFFKNLLIMAGVSVFLYLKHFWGGGDSKLLFCLILLIPGRLYDADEKIPGIICLIMVFLIAYIYVIIDSIRGYLKKEHFSKGSKLKRQDLPIILRDYFVIYMIIRLVRIFGVNFFSDFYQHNTMLITVINVVIILGLADHRLMKNSIFIIVLIVLTLLSLFFSQERINMEWTEIIRNALIIVLSLMLRNFASGYNYESIGVMDVKKGMILSYSTVLLFSKSRIKGLPQSTTEDMRDRISEEQAEAIQRWGKSKNGKDTIVIVKKIPFALFLVVGTFLYILVRIML